VAIGQHEHGVLLTVAYEGTQFSGWATQRDTRTVEDVLRGAILTQDPRALGPRGSSRTDAGVHAQGQLAAFDTSLFMPSRGWVLVLNRDLPDDVSVRAARAVPVGYNPRFGGVYKRYRYRIVRDKVRDPLLHHRAWRVGYEMDMARMAREKEAIVGTHDFAAFRSVKDEREITVRAIRAVSLEVDPLDPRQLSIVIEGNAFLYNMVRILVGTLVDVARDNLPEGTIARALLSKERGQAGQTAPAHGLTLEHIEMGLAPDQGAPWPP